MRKSLIAGAVLAVAGTGAAVPYFTGVQAERAFRDNLKTLSENPRLDVRMVRYDRHWLGAEAESELTLRSTEEPITIHLRHKITHGPTFGHLALARVVTTPVVPRQARPAVTRFFGDQPPLTAELTIGLTGAQEVTLSSPPCQGTPADHPETRVKWSGLTGRGTFNGAAGTLHLEVPGIRVSNPEGHLSLQDVELRSRFRRSGEHLWLGHSDLSADAFDLKAPDPGTGTSQHFKVTGLSLTQRLQESGDGDFLALASKISADRAAAGDDSLRGARLALELRHLDADAYRELSHRFRDLKSRGLTEQEVARQGWGIFQRMLPRFLAGSPRFALTDLHFRTPRGEFHGSARASYEGDGGGTRMALANPALLLRGLKAKAEMEAGKPLVVGFLEDWTRGRIRKRMGPQADPVRMEKIVKRAVRQRLGMMEAMGFLTAKKDRYVTKVAWNQGSLSINGRSMSAAGPMGGGSP
ncbi:MAG TPA: YdgA family protein, partial [Gammaproteobacteria bacterium]|nr:YdgA family protein [Gammaproteobacteria bacterium]